MRAKFIYEKFEKDSDPIHDLGIGLPTIYVNLKGGDILRVKKTLKFQGSNDILRQNSYVRVNDILQRVDNITEDLCISCSFFKNKGELLKNIKNWRKFKDSALSWNFGYEFFKEWFDKVDIEYLKESVNEKLKIKYKK
jgi:hypothetical protein